MIESLNALFLNPINNPSTTISSFLLGFVVGWSAKRIFAKPEYIPTECVSEAPHRINYTSIRVFGKEKDVMCPKLNKDFICMDSNKPCYRKKR